jgi:hypothetical protein
MHKALHAFSTSCFAITVSSSVRKSQISQLVCIALEAVCNQNFSMLPLSTGNDLHPATQSLKQLNARSTLKSLGSIQWFQQHHN